VKAQVAESGNWVCVKCRSERFRALEEKLQDALRQIDTLTRKNKTLEEQVRLATDRGEVSRSENVQGHTEGGNCLVLGDSIVGNVERECSDLKVECFPGIRTEQLRRVIENRDFGTPDVFIIHVGTNDMKRTGNLNYVMGDAHELISAAKTKFSASRVVLSGVLQRRDVSWQHIGAINDKLEWVATALGVTFVDPNCWIDDWNFNRDGLHINCIGSRHLGQLYSRVCGVGGGRQNTGSE
jgi:hypothetical protein